MKSTAQVKQAISLIPWFRELKPEYFEELVRISTLVVAEEGEELFKEGDQQDFVYIVMEGRVALEIFVPHRGRVRILTAEPLDIIGWSSVTPVVRQRTANGRVIVRSKLIAINAGLLRELCEQNHELGYIVMRRIANVIASRLMTTRLQLLDMFAHPNLETENAG